MVGLKDGLGYEEVNQEITLTEIVSGTNIYGAGSITSPVAVLTTMSGTNLFCAGSVNAGQIVSSNNVLLSAGSPYGKGIVLQMTARGVISGGQFVMGSGNLAMVAAASSKAPLGVALPGVNVASGGTVNIIHKGVVPVVAEGTIAIGAPAMMGAGAGLNCVNAADAGSGTRTFPVLDAGASGSTVFILL